MTRFPAMQCVFALAIAITPFPASAQEAIKLPAVAKKDDKPAQPAAVATVEAIAKRANPSIVVITFLGRDGKTAGLGTGFVISADGLIATNHHVIGEARPIFVKFADGKSFDVTSVHAHDRRLDLAVLKITAKDLPVLTLGDSDKLEAGQAVVAIGNPQGLEHSVVAGVVSARREVDERPMIQVAIPIEQGNSGGPLLDMQGRVQGIMNMKSLKTPNLGFAVEINSLKPMLAKPNPIAMSRWLTIGALDPREWKPLMGARWWQRAGQLFCESWGTGFGGRSLCLSGQPALELPFEIGAAVKLDDEAGAAGLIFHSDGEDKHYGFYPSSGKLRLSRFDGPDVFSWKVLKEVGSPHYRPGEWNYLKVRLEADKIRCYVNDQLVIESDDQGLTRGSVGVAKFRATRAVFKRFQMAKELPPAMVPEKLAAEVRARVENIAPLGPPAQEMVDGVSAVGSPGVQALRDRARLLEQQAGQLRTLAREVHRQRVRAALVKELSQDEEKIDLLAGALLLAWHDNDELEIETYRRQFDRLAGDLKKSLPEKADDTAKLERLVKFLFDEQGFHGSRGDYYSPSNSYLNEVLDDREGLPITLSVLFLELARRIGLRAEGVGLPGHFVVQVRPAKGESQLIDPFDSGKRMTREEAGKIVLEGTGAELRDAHLAPATKRAILTRMLQNLLGFPRRNEDAEGMLPYLDTILAIQPASAGERWIRALIRYQTGRREEAIADVDWVIEHEPEGLDLDQARELRALLEKQREAKE